MRLDTSDGAGVGVHWFGPSWGAPICDPNRYITTPDAPCAGCVQPIEFYDRGVALVLVFTDEAATETYYHLVCFLQDIGVDVELALD